VTAAIHYSTHALVGVAVYAAGRTWHRSRRAAWLTVAAVSTGVLHMEHHPRMRRTP